MRFCWLWVTESAFLVGRLVSLSGICWHQILVFWDSIPQTFVPSSPFPSFWWWWWWTRGSAACRLTRCRPSWKCRVRIEQLWGLLQILCIRGSPWGWSGHRPGEECDLPFCGFNCHTVTVTDVTLSDCLVRVSVIFPTDSHICLLWHILMEPTRHVGSYV